MSTQAMTTEPHAFTGRNSFVAPAEPPPLRIAVWVGTKQKLVTGLVRSTTCEDVVQALVHQEHLDSEAPWQLYEAWGKEERSLRGRAKVVKVLKGWGEDLPYVKFSLRLRGGDSVHEKSREFSAEYSRDHSKSYKDISSDWSSGHQSQEYRDISGRSMSHPSLHSSNQDVIKQNKSADGWTNQHPAFRNISLEQIKERSHHGSDMSLSTSHGSNSLLSQSRREENAEAIRRLLLLMQEQDRQLQEQMSRIRDVEQQIDEHETRMHMSRIEEDGVNYIQAGYLISSEDGSTDSGSPQIRSPIPMAELNSASTLDQLESAADTTMIEADQTVCSDVPEAEQYVTICEDVSRVEERLQSEKERIQSLSMLISEATEALVMGNNTSSSNSMLRNNHSVSMSETIKKEISLVKAAMQSSLYVSMSQEEQLNKMSKALDDVHKELKNKEIKLNQLMAELRDEVREDLDGQTSQEMLNKSVKQNVSAFTGNNTEYSLLNDNPIGENLVSDILLRYKSNLEKIQAGINETTLFGNTSSSSDDSHDSGISGSEPEKDSDHGSNTSSPERTNASCYDRTNERNSGSSDELTNANSCEVTNDRNIGSSYERTNSCSYEKTNASHCSKDNSSSYEKTNANSCAQSELSQSHISVVCQNSSNMTDQTLPNDTLQPLEGLVGETVLTSTPVVLQGLQSMSRVNHDSKPPQARLIDQVRLQAHLVRNNLTDDGKQDSQQTSKWSEEELVMKTRTEDVDEDQNNTLLESTADNTYQDLFVPPLPQREATSDNSDDEDSNETFQMHLKSPMPARKRVAFSERDSIREITMYSIMHRTMEDRSDESEGEEEFPAEMSNMTQDITNSSGDIRCWAIACASKKKGSYDLRKFERRPYPKQVPQQRAPPPDRFLVTLHPHATLALASQHPGSVPPTPLRVDPPPRSHSQTLTGVPSRYFPSTADRENESYRMAVYNYSPENESYNNYLSSNSNQLSIVQTPVASKVNKWTAKGKKTCKGEKEQTSSHKKLPFIKKFKMPWHSEKKANKGVKVEVVGVKKTSNKTLFPDTVNDSYRLALGEESHKPSVIVDNGDSQAEEHAPSKEQLLRRDVFRHSISEGQLSRQTPSRVVPGSQSCHTTPNKRQLPSTPGTPRTPRSQRGNESLAFTPLGRSYTMPDIAKIGLSWIYDYDGNCSGGVDLDVTLMESDKRAEQCSPGSSCSDSEHVLPSRRHLQQVPLDGRDMVPYCTYSSYENDGNYVTSDIDAICGLNGNADDVPVMETLV